MIAPPAFWLAENGDRHPAARLLRPLGALYGRIVSAKAARSAAPRLGAPLVCIGNATMGGVGKTPFTRFLGQCLSAGGWRPVALLRGYGGELDGPVAVTADHTVGEIGDEAVMLHDHLPVIVAKDRAQGAAFAAAHGYDVILMDDGLQNPSVHKSLSFLVVDGEAGFGNGLVFPAGPLREPAAGAAARAEAIILFGTPTPSLRATLDAFDRPVFTGRIETDVSGLEKDRRYLAFAGIGRPAKFFESAARAGLDIVAAVPFPDHHPYSRSELDGLAERATALGAELLTTEKDHVRLPPDVRAACRVTPARLTLDREDECLSLIFDMLKATATP